MSISREELKGESSEEESSETGNYEINSSVEALPQPTRTAKINRGMTYNRGGGINGMQKLFNQKDISDDENDSSASEEEEKREKKKNKMKKLNNKKRNLREDNDEMSQINSFKRDSDLKSLIANIAMIKGLNRINTNNSRAGTRKIKKDNEGDSKQDMKKDKKEKKDKKVEDDDVHNYLQLEDDLTQMDDLTFGSYIVISIENEKEQKQSKNYKAGNKTEHRKFNSKYRISDSLKAEKMSKDNYESNCVFRIIPAAQFSIMNKLRDIVTDEIIPPNFELDYENFMSEMEDSVDAQDDLMGKPIKYGTKFQLVQDSSKRFLSLKPTDNERVKKIFNNRYVDTQCFDL